MRRGLRRAQLVGASSHTPKAAGWIRSEGTNPRCRFETWSGRLREATNQCFSLTSVFLSLSLPSSSLKITKQSSPEKSGEDYKRRNKQGKEGRKGERKEKETEHLTLSQKRA